MSKIQTTIEGVTAQLKVAEHFALCYQSKLPETFGHFSIDAESVSFFCALEHVSDAERQASLQIMGEVFGRQGWESKLNYNRKAYDWSKTLDNVRLCIYGATLVDVPTSFPVPASSFPILLE